MKLKDFLTEATSSPSELLLALDGHFSEENEDLPKGARHPGMARVVFYDSPDHIYSLMPKQELDHLINTVIKMINNSTTSYWYTECSDVLALHKSSIGQLYQFIEHYGSYSISLPEVEDTLYLLKNNASSKNVQGVLGTMFDLVGNAPTFEEHIAETTHFLDLCKNMLLYFHYYRTLLDGLPEMDASFIKASFRQLGVKLT